MDEFTGGVVITSEASLINGYPVVLTVNEVASILKISRSKAYELVNSKGFPTKHIGRRLRIPRDMFFTWLNNLDTKERDTPQSWKAAKNL